MIACCCNIYGDAGGVAGPALPVPSGEVAESEAPFDLEAAALSAESRIVAAIARLAR